MADCFIKIEQVNGEAQDADFSGYIQVDSWQWGVAHHSHYGAVSTARGSGAKIDHLSFVHKTDSAFTGLLARCIKNTLIPSACLVMRRAGGEAQKYLTINLEKVRIKSVEIIHDEVHVIPAVKVALKFERVIVEYAAQSARGADKNGRSSFDWTGQIADM